MYPSGLEFSVAAAEQSQLAVWIKAATPDPAAQEVVHPRNHETFQIIFVEANLKIAISQFL